MVADKFEFNAVKKATEDNRGQWGSFMEMILACIGYSVGFGNIWRFPYLAYTNGGGAFLIPYVVAVTIAGRPIYFLELCVGQFSQTGPNRVFEYMAPLFTGVGWSMVVMSFLVSIYYNMILAWVLWYFFASFRSELQWKNYAECRSDRDDVWCRTVLNDTGSFYVNGSCRSTTFVLANNIEQLVNNATVYNQSWQSPADEYFHNYVLDISDGLTSFWDLGPMSWKLVLAMLGAWILVFLCIVKGVQSSGKIVYFTSTFPYVVLAILLIRGVTLPGAYEGIMFYIKPDISMLGRASVWYAAATQVFYSLGTTFGGITTLASYSKFSNNCWRDALIIAVADSLTSFFAGFAIFSVIGFMSQALNQPIERVARTGPGLAFVAYPEALGRMPVGPLWSILFFFMMVLLGLDSQFGMVETVTTALFDQFPVLRKAKPLTVAFVCCVTFLLALPLCTRSGMYIFQLIDGYSSGYCLVLTAILEVSVVMYIYGIRRFIEDIQSMLGFKPGWYWIVCWCFFTPVFLTFIFIFTFIDMTPPTYGNYVFAGWFQGVGWGLSLLSLVCIPGFAVYQLCLFLVKGRPLAGLLRPTYEWTVAYNREKLAGNAYDSTNTKQSCMSIC